MNRIGKICMAVTRVQKMNTVYKLPTWHGEGIGKWLLLVEGNRLYKFPRNADFC